MTLHTAMAYLSGLYWVAPGLDLPTLFGTTVTANICNATMCRLFAHNNRYPKNLWTLLGFTLGIWAVTVLILLPHRGGSAGRVD